VEAVEADGMESLEVRGDPEGAVEAVQRVTSDQVFQDKEILVVDLTGLELAAEAEKVPLEQLRLVTQQVDLAVMD
jgi:hypothetical protein